MTHITKLHHGVEYVDDFAGMMEPDFSEYPNEEYRNQWMREYLQSQWEIDGRQRPLTEQKFNLLKYHVTKTQLVGKRSMLLS